MKPCEHKIKMTPEEEKQLNESVLAILSEGLNIVRKRFPNIKDLYEEDPLKLWYKEDEKEPPYPKDHP